MQVNPPTGHLYTAEEMTQMLAADHERAMRGLVMVEGSPEDVARLSEAVRLHGDLASNERARRRKARKVARQSRRANRH